MAGKKRRNAIVQLSPSKPLVQSEVKGVTNAQAYAVRLMLQDIRDTGNEVVRNTFGKVDMLNEYLVEIGVCEKGDSDGS